MTRAIALAVVAAAALAACFKSASDLQPFPCATDLGCPGGLACVDGQCATARLDATCTTGGDASDCNAAGANVVCSASVGLGSASGSNQVGSGSPIAPPVGACEVPCSPGCPTGHTCSSQLADGVCLVDCTDGTVCPANTACHARADSRKLCVPKGVACQAVTSPVRCKTLCTTEARGTTCSNGTSTCPADASCDVDHSLCFCNIGRIAFDCTNDTPCTGNCTGGNFWCAPDVSTFSCKSDLDGVSAICQCWDGRAVNVSCNASGKSCEDVCAGR